jgi:hypothetical protein
MCQKTQNTYTTKSAKKYLMDGVMRALWRGHLRAKDYIYIYIYIYNKLKKYNLGSSLQSLKAGNLFSNNIIIVALYAPFKRTPRV